MPPIDRRAISLIADIDNCMTHTYDLKDETDVHCLLDPNQNSQFKAKCTIDNGHAHFELCMLEIKNYLSAGPISAYMYLHPEE
jgi:hypothetical protein